jgi:hypothetical protein
MGTSSTSYRLFYLGGKQPVDDQIREAARQYTAKEGKAPNLCLIHPSLIDQPKTLDGIRVEPYPGMLHFDIWLACSEIIPTQPHLFDR